MKIEVQGSEVATVEKYNCDIAFEVVDGAVVNGNDTITMQELRDMMIPKVEELEESNEYASGIDLA